MDKVDIKDTNKDPNEHAELSKNHFKELYSKEQKKSRLLLFGVIVASLLFVISLVIGVSNADHQQMKPNGMYRNFDDHPSMRGGGQYYRN